MEGGGRVRVRDDSDGEKYLKEERTGGGVKYGPPLSAMCP